MLSHLSQRYPYPLHVQSAYAAALKRLFRRVSGFDDDAGIYLGVNFQARNFTLRVLAQDACSCGADERLNAWRAEQSHTATCYQSQLRQALEALDEYFSANAPDPLYDEQPSDWLADFPGAVFLIPVNEPRVRQYEQQRADLTRGLQQRLGLPAATPPDYCSCGLQAQLHRLHNNLPHASTCELMAPGFEHVPTGLALWWDHHPVRGGLANQSLNIERFDAIMQDCASDFRGRLPYNRKKVNFL